MKLESKLNNLIKEGNPKSLTHQGKKVYLSQKKLRELKQEQEKHEGGILPLVTLLPLIFGSIAAAGSAASGIATAVTAAKKSKIDELSLQEEKRHNTEIEKAVKGEGIINDFVSRTELAEEGKNSLCALLKLLSCLFDIQKDGDGIFLNSYTGGALYLSPWKGSGIKEFISNTDGLDEADKKILYNIFKNLSHCISIGKK